MAVLKDLIVHGPSRFLNGSRFNTINAESIGAEQGIFNKLIATTLDAKEATIDNLTAQNATVVGLLDVQGELHTNAWTNANIANIGGSFYISPTVEPTDGTTTISITRVSATSWTVSATGTFATDFIKSGTATSGVAWPANSLVLITGDVVIGDMIYPLGTLKGTLNAAVTATAASTSKTITITGVTDAQNNNAPSVLQELYELNNNANISNAAFKKGKISLYKLGSNPIGILMTSMGTNSNSLMDIYGGVSTNPSVRIGHLAGLPNINGSAPTGWGIYTDNGYFSGVIVSTSGKIANWSITNNSLQTGNYNTSGTMYFGSSGLSLSNTFSVTPAGALSCTSGYIANWKIESNDLVTGTWGADNSAMLCTGTSTSKSIGGSGSINGWVFTAGANFGVTKSGALYATSAHITGEITANSGKIGKWNIETSTGTPTYGGAIYTGTFGSDEGIYITPKYYSNTDIAGSYSSVAQQDTSPTAGYYNWCIAVSNKFGVTNTGKMFASEGMIAGFSMASKTLMTNNSSGGMIYISSNSNRDAFSANYEYPSNITPSSDRGYFRVTQNGVMYAQGADITGDIKAQSFIAYDYYNSTYRTRAIVNTDGLTVYDGGGTADANKVAIFGSTVQVGKKAVGYTTIASTGMDIYAGSSNTNLAHIGYASGNAQSGTAVAPYYTFGTRNSSSEIGNYSSVMGSYLTASGFASYAEGFNNYALGNGSHAEGMATEALGVCSHAEGGDTTAKGQDSHAEGSNTNALGANSHAQNYYTVATESYQTVIGRYNKATVTTTNNITTYSDVGNYAFIIGNGNNNTTAARSNALTVDWDGNVNIASGAKYKINGTALSASDVGAVPTTRTVNSKALSSNISLTASDVSAVPTSDVSTTGGNNKVIKSNSSGNVTITGNIRAATESTTITIPTANKFSVYTGSPYTSNTDIKLRRFGNVVTITGMVKPKETIAGSDTEYTICSIPTAYSSWCPPQVIVQIMQGSTQYKWCLKINTNGTVTFSRYSGTTSYAQVTTSTWLPFHATWIVDS